jgi:predicted dehydrogenase
MPENPEPDAQARPKKGAASMHCHRVLLLGLGFWGDRWIQALLRSPRCEVVGISAGRKRLDATAAAHGIPRERGHEDYRWAITACAADVAVISLPTELHADAALRAMDRGMHVLIEKPLASSRAEADTLREGLARHPGLKFMVSQNYRWRPYNQRLRRAIREGMIGRVGSMQVEFRQPECFIGYREFLPRPLLQDVCIHHFDLIRFFAGCDGERIGAWVSRPPWSRYQGDPSVDALIGLKGGAVANYHGTWASRGRETTWDGSITITGEKGSLYLDGCNHVRFFLPEDSEGRVLENEAMAATELDCALVDFFDCVEQDRTPETSLDDNYQSFAMVCGAEESARTGRTVAL